MGKKSERREKRIAAALARKAEWDAGEPARRAEAERLEKERWDAMTPEQKAAERERRAKLRAFLSIANEVMDYDPLLNFKPESVLYRRR